MATFWQLLDRWDRKNPIPDLMVEDEFGCWIWQKSKTRDGTARFRMSGQLVTVGRFLLDILDTPYLECSHICGRGNAGCVHPLHLIAETHKDNQQRRARHGTSPRGENSGRTHLTDDDVLDIYDRLWNGETAKSLGDEYGIHPSEASRIKHGQRWNHITSHPPV